jgi:hypothetical protein
MLCVCVFKVFLQHPSCPTCSLPLQPVGETVRELGACGVETVMHYECSNCDRALQRRYILAHLG